MNQYVLSCCSTADLSREHLQQRDIHYVCFHFQLAGKEYPDDLGASVPFAEFYARMAEGADTKTSQVNSTEYLTYFTKFLEQGMDILHVCLSSGISGTYNSAMTAAAIAQERYPDRVIRIVDSLAASSGYGLLMDRLADLRDEGKSLAEVGDWAEQHRLNLQHWFFATDLSYLMRGGRISRSAEFFGTLLHIVPLLNVNDEGRLTPRAKLHGTRAAIREIVNRMEAHAEGGLEYSGKCYICNSACQETAEQVAHLIEQRFPRLNGKVQIYSIGTTIGAHTGPGTVAVFFWGDRRTA